MKAEFFDSYDFQTVAGSTDVLGQIILPFHRSVGIYERCIKICRLVADCGETFTHRGESQYSATESLSNPAPNLRSFIRPLH